MDQKQIDRQVAEVLKKMSGETGIGIQDLTDEYKAYVTQMGNPVGALAKLKSTHKFQLGGKPGLFTGRVCGKGRTRNGRGYSWIWLMSAPGQMEARPRRLWDTDEKVYSTSLSQDQIVQFNGKLMPRSENVIVMSGESATVNVPFPTVAEIAEKAKAYTPLGKIENFIGQNILVKGVVGKNFQSEVGGGTEICDPLDLESVPVTVYIDGGSQLVEGQEVSVFGYVNQKSSGDIVMNANGIF